MAADVEVLRFPPMGACDCQVHVFGDPSRYPMAANRTYDPPKAEFQDLRIAQQKAGVDRVVMVQATAYGTDHALLLDVLHAHPECRGVATIDDSISEEQLRDMHARGVRGARFGLGSSLQKALPRDEFDRSIKRIAALSWHAKIVCSAADLVRFADWLADMPLPVVLDHLAGLGADRVRDRDAFSLVLELLRSQGFWFMISNADRRSAFESGWRDMFEAASAGYAAAPNRTIWASDWPHLRYARANPPAMADLLAFLRRALPTPEAIRQVLVDNPARLYFAS